MAMNNCLKYIIWIVLICLGIDCLAQIDTAKIYFRKCAGCHGIDGDGAGPGADIVFPKPRNFQTWMFKFKTTPADSPPTDEDLMRIIKNGLPGTAMPAFKEILTEQEITALSHYLKKFSLFEIPDSITTVQIIQPSGEPDIAQGNTLFKKFECTKCHGENGRGDGPSFPDLKDDWENKILPRNLTKGWTYRRGNSMEDIYVTLKLGVPGTSMPSFLETLQQSEAKSDNVENDLWAIAAYVKSLQEEENFEITVKAKYTESISENAKDEIWKDAEAVRFPLIGQITLPPRHFTPSVEDVLVKAIHNGNEVTILVQWDDATKTSDSLPDKFAIQFPITVKERERPFFFMGDKDNPVNLWIFDNGEIYEGFAEGAGTLVKQNNNDISGSWKYEDGRYSVVFKRALNTGDEKDIAMELKKFATASFFVWDGYNGEMDMKCAVSSWYFFVPEGESSAKLWYVPIIVILLTFLIEVIIVRRAKKKIEYV